jgi:hypothetical protein
MHSSRRFPPSSFQTMTRDQLTIAVVALAISFVAITEVMLSLM